MTKNTPPEWKDLEIKTWKPDEEGQTVEGDLIERRKDSMHDPTEYDLAHDKKVVRVHGNPDLDRRMSVLSEGVRVRFRFDGMKVDANGNPYRSIHIQFLPASPEE